MGSDSPRFLLVVRFLLLVFAGSAAVAAFVWVRGADAQAERGSVVYGCPMHPQVRAASPGDCPICRMALEPVKGAVVAPPAAHAHGEQSKHEHEHEAPHDPVPKGSFSIPSSPIFRAFDAASRVMTRPVSLEMRAPASVDSESGGVALYFLDESKLVTAGEEGRFLPNGTPEAGAEPVPVRVSSALPSRWDARTALVRFETDGRKLTPGATGSLKLATRLRHDLVIKASAIVASPGGSDVFVVSKDRRTFSRRRVEIGNVIYGLATVVSGLAPDEYVAAKHTFALDAEWRARQGVSL